MCNRKRKVGSQKQEYEHLQGQEGETDKKTG